MAHGVEESQALRTQAVGLPGSESNQSRIEKNGTM